MAIIATSALYGLGYVTINILVGLLFGGLALAGLRSLRRSSSLPIT